jgi:hypothetical protein
MSCSSINSCQHVTAIKNQDSSLKAVLLPRISTFGARSYCSLHHKTVSLTIRCSSTSKQGSQKQKLTTSKHISSFSHCQKPVWCTWIFFNSQFSTILLSTRWQTVAHRWKQTNAFSLFQANVGTFLFKVRISNITSSSCRFILSERHIKALAMTHRSRTRGWRTGRRHIKALAMTHRSRTRWRTAQVNDDTTHRSVISPLKLDMHSTRSSKLVCHRDCFGVCNSTHPLSSVLQSARRALAW